MGDGGGVADPTATWGLRGFDASAETVLHFAEGGVRERGRGGVGVAPSNLTSLSDFDKLRSSTEEEAREMKRIGRDGLMAQTVMGRESSRLVEL
jgi:hypothetical protein